MSGAASSELWTPHPLLSSDHQPGLLHRVTEADDGAQSQFWSPMLGEWCRCADSCPYPDSPRVCYALTWCEPVATRPR